MTTIDEFAARYVAVWNEPDEAVRRRAPAPGAVAVTARCGHP